MSEIFTIGYGNRPIGDFISLLQRYGVDLVVDSRSIPYSRFHAAYRKKALQDHLEKAGIHYLFLGDSLGGKRTEPDCLTDGKVAPRLVWAKESFRAALEQVIRAAQEGHVLALMCAELRPGQCHRAWMLAPPLEESGLAVLHIDETGGLKTTAEVLGWFQ